MNDLIAPVKFMIWITAVVFALGLAGSLGKMTVKMGEVALEAFQRDQMSYGKFSRQLWSSTSKQPKRASSQTDQ